MADIVIKILEPASTFNLLELDELKIALGIDPNDTTQDARLNQWITRASATVSIMCNRVFAKETLSETWNELQGNRLFVSHWPIAAADLQSVEAPAGTILDPSDYALEEQSGKIQLLQSTSQPIVVTYTGGFDLPDGDPKASGYDQAALEALKQACQLLVMEQRAIAMYLQTSGIRSIRHKEANVQFIDPAAFFGKNTGLLGGASAAANALLMHYVRLQV
jgi:hypothetical protein